MFELIAIMLLSQQPLQPALEGYASYYTVNSSSGYTASGERFRDDLFTCAMNIGEFGEEYLVVAENGRSVVCKLNDRGPFHKNRVIDLSKAAMRELGLLGAGVGHVRIYPMGDSSVASSGFPGAPRGPSPQ
jgi:rare lipoprotein A